MAGVHLLVPVSLVREEIMSPCAERVEGSESMICSALAVVGLLMMLAACSRHEPKPMVQPTTDQVRGHADRSFDKLKQEEQERGSQPAVSR
jgi:hypothetical protein